jgi:GTP-binding protein Era
MAKREAYKSGYAAIIGKPNTGKSTLMNALLGSKLSIATHKAQTTRHQIAGIYSDDEAQIIFLDTPGIIDPQYELQKVMMRFVEKAEKEADLILLIVDASEPAIDEELLISVNKLRKPLILILNKMDLSDQQSIMDLAEVFQSRLPVEDTIFTSALHGEGIESLITSVKSKLPNGPQLYPEDMLSEHPVRFFVAELIREQIFLQFHEELPYSCTVEVIQYEEREDLDYINAEIIVNRKSQKGMLIGKGGSAIKKLGAAARKQIEELVGKKVFLDLHVKVRDKWREDENMLRNLGYR